jgi:F0F1-type ATP synthase delta subunit
MITKEQKIKLIVDVKKGHVRPDVIKVLDNPFVLVSEKERLINGIVHEPQAFNSILNYITKDLKINCLYLMWENCRNDMVEFNERLMK